MKIAVQGVFDLGYSLGFSDNSLEALFTDSNENFHLIEKDGNYTSTTEKASFGFSLRNGYGYVFNIKDTEIESVWNREAKRIAFELTTFKTEFSDSDQDIKLMQEMWVDIKHESTRIILFASGICEIEKIMTIPDLENSAVPISILHCYEYSGYGAYFEKENDISRIIYNYVQKRINNGLEQRSRNRETKKLKSSIKYLMNLTTRVENIKDFGIKTFTLFIFSTDENIITNIYNNRINNNKDKAEDYNIMTIEMDKCYISWYIELIFIRQNGGYKYVDNYLFYFRHFDQFVNNTDIVNQILVKINEELINNNYKGKFGIKLKENDIRILRNYLNNTYNGLKIYNMTKDQELIEMYNFMTSKINLDRTKNDCKDELVEIDNHIDDFIEIRNKKNENTIAIIATVFSATGLVQLIIELLKIFNVL